MPSTTNYGFPLVADTPPTGMTGKELRNTIVGEDATSLANMVDVALKDVSDSVPTKTSELTNDSNFPSSNTVLKLESIEGVAVKDIPGTATSSYVVNNYYRDWNLDTVEAPPLLYAVIGTNEFLGQRQTLSAGYRYSFNDTVAALCSIVIVSGTVGEEVSLTQSQVKELFLLNPGEGVTTTLMPGFYAPRNPNVLNMDCKSVTEIAITPTKTSQLTNDSGFISSGDIPTKTSQLTNDSGFVTSDAIPTTTSQLTNDSGFVTSEAIPTTTSQLTNDSGFITSGNALNPEYVNGVVVQKIPTSNAYSGSGGIYCSRYNLEITDAPSLLRVEGYVSNGSQVEMVELTMQRQECDGGYVYVSSEDPTYRVVIVSGTVGETVTLSENQMSELFLSGSDYDVYPGIYRTSYDTETGKKVISFISEVIISPESISQLSEKTTLFSWDGDTTGKLCIVDMLYKINENTYVPDTISNYSYHYQYEVNFFYQESASIQYDLRDAYGLVVYENMGIVIATRAGTLPAAVVSQLSGGRYNVDVDFEAGTYAGHSNSTEYTQYVKEAWYYTPPEEYVRQNMAAATTTDNGLMSATDKAQLDEMWAWYQAQKEATT